MKEGLVTVTLLYLNAKKWSSRCQFSFRFVFGFNYLFVLSYVDVVGDLSFKSWLPIYIALWIVLAGELEAHGTVFLLFFSFFSVQGGQLKTVVI